MKKSFILLIIILIISFAFNIYAQSSPSPVPTALIKPQISFVIDQENLKKSNKLLYSPNEILVEFKEDPNVLVVKTKFSSINILNEKYKVKKIEKVIKKTELDIANRLYKLQLDFQVEEAIEAFKNDPNVIIAELNYIHYTSYIPDDSLYNQQWAHKITQAEAGWDIEKGDKEIIIAVIDSGVDYTHEDLYENILGDCTDKDGEVGCPEGTGFDFVDIDKQEYIDRGYKLVPEEDYASQDNDPSDVYGHGTHVAGIIAAKGSNGIGVSGVCPECSIMPLRAGFLIDQEDEHYGLLPLDSIISAIYYAVDNNAKVISMSFSGKYVSEEEKKAMAYAHNKGVILIAAAGNNPNSGENYPAALENIIAVTATDINDKKASFSTFGYWTDIGAPGEDILSTFVRKGPVGEFSGYKILSGTSMATPYVSGVIGLLLSKYPDLTPDEIEEIIKESTDTPKENENYFGVGRVNVQKALLTQRLPQNVIATISSPYNGEIVIGNTLDVKGEVTGDSYIIDYGRGIYPPEWTLIGSGSGNYPENSVIAQWNMDSLEDGIYSIRLSVNNAEGKRIDKKRISILKRDNIKNGWPYNYISYKNNGQLNSPILFDMNKDKFSEILVGKNTQILLSSSGQLFPNWPIIYPSFSFSHSIADLERDGEPDIVIAGLPCILRLNMEGKKIASYCIDSYTLFKTPVISDINNNRNMEIIVTDDKGNLYIFDRNLNLIHDVINFGDYLSMPAIGDIDNDGTKEIVFAGSGSTGGKMYVLQLNGENKPGWPKILNYVSPDEKTAPILADLNNDGNLEIIYLYIKGSIWRYDGSVFWSDGYLPIKEFVMVSDLSNDDKMEIIGYDSSIDSLWILNPLFGWDWIHSKSIQLSESFSGFSLGNIDEDSDLEIIGVSENGKLYAWNKDFSVVEGFPKKIGDTSKSQPIIGDIDNDGINEIIVGADKNIFAFNTKGVSNLDGEWPMFQYNAQHTGCYKCLETLEPKFIRGDANNDERVDLSDSIYLLAYLFQQGKKPICEDSADTNDDGELDVSDAINILLVLFKGNEMPSPYPDFGTDSTSDSLEC